MNINPLTNLSIIIPLAQNENAWASLLEDFKELPTEAEIILVGSNAPPPLLDSFSINKGFQIRWVLAHQGRSSQLNQGAQAAKNKFLWFLHADSRITHKNIKSLAHALSQHENALYYFNLKFLPDGPKLMILNQIGANLRTHIFGLPYGDQGFCLSQETFNKLGGFVENIKTGEDYLLVRKAKQLQIKLKCTNTYIYTSARKYKQQGWLKTSLKHIGFSCKQAMLRWFKIYASSQ
ncbi:MAG: glycosyltransferase [Bdellovibrio sp.]|nr:glycosyltransferase [Bdellovibrio sp.]